MTAELEPDDGSVVVVVKRKLSPLVQLDVEPVGRWYHAYEAWRLRGHYISESGVDEFSGDSSEDDQHDVEIEDDIDYLRSLEPADWKNQDHYAVLGLKHYRFKATDEDIKRAYRIMVLRHHPDKRRATGEEVRDDDDYFTCITKAYEILGIPSRRRAYDSVDPLIDDDVPGVSAHNKADFFQVFGPVFERNARWSVKKHVPSLGYEEDSREKVDRFYGFWYDFDSWREFSYLDEEEKEKGQDREERRWIEKQNKAERARRKKEEMARLRKLVDNAYACDPRIARFKDEDRERKMAQKKARQEALKQKKEEEERVRREAEDVERRRREEEEAEQRAKIELEKKEREKVKKAFKKERKMLRTLCKDHNYYSESGEERLQLMADVEYMCEALELTRFEALNHKLAECNSDSAKGRDLLLKEVREVKVRIEKEKAEIAASAASGSAGCGGEGSGSKHWMSDDLQFLIKAVNLFPAGTSKRWEVVAEYINQHTTSGHKRSAKEVLNKAKELQHSDQQMKDAANKSAYQNIEKNQTLSISDSKASQRYESVQEMLGMNTAPWSNEEQQLLEQALKTYPASTTDRWERIAECIPNRSKRDCMRRYKELVEMVKAKKAAHAAAAAAKK